jgi:cell wall-associated NlpC family hydrolase
MDRRLTPANTRAAHSSLVGKIDAPRFTDGDWAQIVVPLADLLRAPDGARERQLLFGDRFLVIDRHTGFAFGQSAKDGYCGYLPEAALGPDQGATHWVSALATHVYAEPRVQARDLMTLSMGCRVRVTDTAGRFALTPFGAVPANHLRPIGDWASDPVAVAHQFLGTPYLWGGNSRLGIDCSGLAQTALMACGMACPGDSDLQQAIGQEIAPDAPLLRGDLLFWKGHVALVMDPVHILHATGHYMMTVVEGLTEAIDRIIAQGGGPVTARRRP